MATAKKTAAKKSTKTAPEPLVVEFEFEKDTKTTRRYSEVTDGEFAEPKIGTLYVKKAVLADLGGGALPDGLTITIEAN